jgi:hypothetical protein
MSVLSRIFCVAGIAAAVLPAEIIDRIAVTVDNQVITSSEITEQIRVTAFLNSQKPDLSPSERRQTADRLVAQLLVQREMDLTRYPRPTAAEVKEALQQTESRFGSHAEYERQLAADGITSSDVEEALLRQITLLRFIDLRFRPEVQVPESEVKRYYETVLLPEIRRKGIQPEPDFDEVRADCEEALANELVNKRVEAWLNEVRSRARINYQEGAFQ